MDEKYDEEDGWNGFLRGSLLVKVSYCLQERGFPAQAILGLQTDILVAEFSGKNPGYQIDALWKRPHP